MTQLATILALAILMVFETACGGEIPKNNITNETSTNITKTAGNISIESIKMTNSDNETVTSFKPTDNPQKFSVRLNQFESGTKVKGVWTAVNAAGATNQKISEKEIETTSLTNTVDLSISLQEAFPAGDYKFEAYLNGILSKTINYKVQ